MKTIAITLVGLAAAILSTLAAADVKIEGDNTQTVKMELGGIVANTAVGAMTTAKQNLASNAGNVTIKGKNTQLVDLGKVGIVANTAVGAMSTAKQNLASNTSDQ